MEQTRQGRESTWRRRFSSLLSSSSTGRKWEKRRWASNEDTPSMICTRIRKRQAYIVKGSSDKLVVGLLVAILLHCARNIVDDSPSELVQTVFTNLDDRVYRGTHFLRVLDIVLAVFQQQTRYFDVMFGQVGQARLVRQLHLFILL